MLKKICAIWVGKIILFLTKLLGKGGGTAAPGLYALKIDPQLIEKLSLSCKKGSIVITGTNGKTTTSRLISHYFSRNEISYIHNRAGSNLERGIASAYIAASNWSGSFSTDYGLWELDEATFTNVVSKIKPDTILLLNLFRDQLDRYGEVDATKNRWLNALSQIEKKTTFIYNADDAQLVHLIGLLQLKQSKHAYAPFTIKAVRENISENDILSPVELVLCPRCKNKLAMSDTITGIGTFSCNNCKLSNPESNYYVSNWKIENTESSGVFTYNKDSFPFTLPFPGLFNIYNFLAAATCIEVLSLNTKHFIEIASTYTPAFARMERIKIKDTEFILNLIKNPTGFTESLKTIFNAQSTYATAIFILNDKYADGKDVSWIWDVNIPRHIPENLAVKVGGTRKYDMATRLKYAGVPENKITICENLHEIFSEESTITPVFATYTASLELQNYFEKIGAKNKYWKE